MDPVIRPLLDDDRPAVARLLDDAVGEGFWRFADGDGALSFVAVTGAGVAGVVLTCLEPDDDPDVRTALAGSAAAAAGSGRLVLHVRQLAVAPAARRGGLASRLLARAETEALARGAGVAFAFGWLPAGRPEPDAVPFYEASRLPGRAGHRRLLRRGQRGDRRAVPVLRRAAVPLRGAAVRQGPDAGLTRPGRPRAAGALDAA